MAVRVRATVRVRGRVGRYGHLVRVAVRVRARVRAR